MTRGGPGFTTDVITSTIYKQYQAGFYGLATAGNVILFVGVLLLVVPDDAVLRAPGDRAVRSRSRGTSAVDVVAPRRRGHRVRRPVPVHAAHGGQGPRGRPRASSSACRRVAPPGEPAGGPRHARRPDRHGLPEQHRADRRVRRPHRHRRHDGRLRPPAPPGPGRRPRGGHAAAGPHPAARARADHLRPPVDGPLQDAARADPRGGGAHPAVRGAHLPDLHDRHPAGARRGRHHRWRDALVALPARHLPAPPPRRHHGHRGGVGDRLQRLRQPALLPARATTTRPCS